MGRKRDQTPPTREEKIAALRYHRAHMSAQARRKFDKETATLREEGYVDADGLLTPAGELRLHQLTLLKWMKERQERKQQEAQMNQTNKESE
jgi:hypothetical protein